MLVEEIIRNNMRYNKNGNIYSFIQDEEERPLWSQRLNNYFINSNADLKMTEKYKQNKLRINESAYKRFFDYISENEGIGVDLASGPSGYFSPALDRLSENYVFIVTDACPAVINAHSSACDNPNFYVFDMDLDKELPFKNESVTAFSGNLLNNVDHYADLINEAYRCLKFGGRFAVIEMFFEHGCKTYEYLNNQGAVWASFETFVEYCRNVGFVYKDSEIINSRKGKISDGDLFPLDDNDCSTDRMIYFEK
ncbi:MAG: class I SAM-dependent methyltransferase [Clostridiaceae bacterium]|nr:class I SAM-dependent methyltransferase [Clostridiaceae bacterium]